MSIYDNYARPSADGRTIVLRASLFHDWDEAFNRWAPDGARKLAAHLIELADKLDRESPEVVELTEDLAEVDGTVESWEEMAMALVRKGYGKCPR